MNISDLISEDPVNSYYIVDSMAPSDVETKFTILLTMPRNDIIARCKVHDYIDNEGEDLGDKYSGKAIHIHPKPNFKDKEFIPASEIISKALYENTKKTTKD